MQKILRQVAGIDMAQKDFVVSLGRIDETLMEEVYASKKFVNTRDGFIKLQEWIMEKTVRNPEVLYVMEATGVYHEALAYYLAEHHCSVSIVLPNKISNYFRTLSIKTQTDSTMAETIARFGLSRSLEKWSRPKKVFKDMRQLTRERDQLIQMRTMAKNQLHAERAEAFPNSGTIERSLMQVSFFDQQEKQILSEINAVVQLDEQVKILMALICSIPGIGKLTAAIILAETNGFELIHNKRQLASYAGFDVIHKQSGTSVNGKPRISKKGNRHLRKALHLPALTAIRHDERFKAIFARIVGKHGIKMKAAVAIQRKLLEMAYTVCKSNSPYDKEYLKKLESNQKATL